MEDRDIIKALECCRNGLCTDCPRLNTPSAILRCKEELMCDALDLINRQKAEIEALKLINSTYNAEVSEVRKIAFQEFAERLKKREQPVIARFKFLGGKYVANGVMCADIDNLVKEMVGEG